ncbi:Helix-turn-helix domain-containing protein [Quadrisphaera granulorum]|uniref:Helix-turn-helix protein n=1 Tax=Quadrisphaera granulorum TaxID=317664 RepID=A0A316AT35_9ACTN|nr:helix-turn-helix domain-containing protein [Quadrisphaera granulorum]PWJ53277.1 helix-turn-helix protein [Quadrisphaera granulorum]SZE96951.1 Helix-turn-helix domain-containing protein [Quadrisphaera granulorum]
MSGENPIVYREERVHPTLAEWVSCVWTYERQYEIDDVEAILPDGWVELVVQLGAPYRDQQGELPACAAIGTLDHPLALTAKGLVRCWSVRFPWWGLAPFGDVGAFDGRQWAPASEVFDAGLVAGVVAAAGSAHPVDELNRVLLAHLLAWPISADAARNAGRHITNNAATLTVEQLALACAASQRTLQRDFRKTLDATPAQMIARVKFERARRLLMDETLPIARVAAEAGYVDQPHLNRAFARFAQLTPRDYRRQFQRATGQDGIVALVQD